MKTKIIPPVDQPFIVTSPYGWRVLRGKKQFHDGIDYVSSVSRNAIAIADGKIIIDFDEYDPRLRWTDGRHSAGNYVCLETIIHGEKYFARYIHLKNNIIANGQHVKQGDILGSWDDVGYSFGAHLHFDMYDASWNKIDPTNILLNGYNI